MDRQEALALLHASLDEYRRLSYAECVARIGGDDIREVTGPSGVAYQIEIQLTWDSRPNGDVRVLGAIDDGGLRAFLPLCSDLIVRPEEDGPNREA